MSVVVPDNLSVIIGASVGGLVGLILIVCLVDCVYRRRRRKRLKRKREEEKLNDQLRGLTPDEFLREGFCDIELMADCEYENSNAIQQLNSNQQINSTQQSNTMKDSARLTHHQHSAALYPNSEQDSLRQQKLKNEIINGNIVSEVKYEEPNINQYDNTTDTRVVSVSNSDKHNFITAHVNDCDLADYEQGHYYDNDLEPVKENKKDIGSNVKNEYYVATDSNVSVDKNARYEKEDFVKNDCNVNLNADKGNDIEKLVTADGTVVYDPVSGNEYFEPNNTTSDTSGGESMSTQSFSDHDHIKGNNFIEDKDPNMCDGIEGENTNNNYYDNDKLSKVCNSKKEDTEHYINSTSPIVNNGNEYTSIEEQLKMQQELIERQKLELEFQQQQMEFERKKLAMEKERLEIARQQEEIKRQLQLQLEENDL
eukprot:Pgem_evm1s15969